MINLPSEEELFDLADFFKVFGDSTRIKILSVLHEGESSVGEIAEALQMNQPAISHQLKTLKQAKLVKVRRDGKNSFYGLDDDHIVTIIEMGLDHIREGM